MFSRMCIHALWICLSEYARGYGSLCACTRECARALCVRVHARARECTCVRALLARVRNDLHVCTCVGVYLGQHVRAHVRLCACVLEFEICHNMEPGAGGRRQPLSALLLGCPWCIKGPSKRSLANRPPKPPVPVSSRLLMGDLSRVALGAVTGPPQQLKGLCIDHVH